MIDRFITLDITGVGSGEMEQAALARARALFGDNYDLSLVTAKFFEEKTTVSGEPVVWSLRATVTAHRNDLPEPPDPTR